MSISKPPASTGSRTVEEVRVLKKKVKVIFDDGSSICLSSFSYASSDTRLFPGKILSEAQISCLSESDAETKFLNYIISLLSLGRPYSGRQILSRLHERKNATVSQAASALRKAEAEGIFDPDAYLKAYIDDAVAKGYAESKIRAELAKEGYAVSEIDRGLSESRAISDPTAIIEKWLTEKQGRNLAAVKHGLIVKLAKLGYSYAPALALIDGYLKTHPDIYADRREKELSNLKSEMSALIADNISLGKGPKLKDYVFRRLLGRMYDIDDIINAWEALKGNDIS